MANKKNNVLVYLGFLLIIAVSLTVYMMPKERTSEFSDYREGLLAPENITAPIDFEILRTDDELKEVKEKVKATVLPVFVLNDTLNLYLYKQFINFNSSFEKTLLLKNNLNAVSDRQVFFESKKDSLSKADPQTYSKQKLSLDSTYQSLRKNYLKEKIVFNQNFNMNFDDLTDPPLLSDSYVRKNVGYFIRRNINEKIFDTQRKDIFNRNTGKFILLNGKEKNEYLLSDFQDITDKKQKDLDFLTSFYKDMDNDSLKYWERIIDNFSKPSVIFSQKITDSEIEKMQNDIPLAEGLVKKGEDIVLKNTIVTKSSIKKLHSLDLKLKELHSADSTAFYKSINVKSILGKVIISSLFYLILVLMLYYNRKKYFYDKKSLTLLFLIIMIQLTIVYFSFKYINNFSPYLITISVTSVLTAVFFDMRVSFVTTIATSIISSLLIGNNFIFIFIPMFAGLFTMYGVNKIRDIFQFIYKTMLYSFLGFLLPGIGFYFLFNSPYDELLKVINHSAINSAVSPLLALTIITIIERLFKLPTDVTLLQLSDMSRPLLKKLQLEAPGTYHHSITVGNLAEAAAEAINANSLLARVGAYYHDIGKTFKAAYFIENQQNMANKHDKMAPNMSAFILSAHVKEGIKLAYENNLPEVIIDFIRTHHGVSRMEYFYNKAVNLAKGTDDKVNESVYRYPGPKPNSKEMAIVMISDVVEAKCRTESEANIDRFRQIINEIILDKLQSGELDECDIKLNDLSKIREAMLPVITGMYHQRIKYPPKMSESPESDLITATENKKENHIEEK